MEAILKHVNEKLEKHKLKLIDQKVLEEHKKVMDAWRNISKSITKPVKFLIVGEATVSWDNYFYNVDANTTSFLSPSQFGCVNKAKLISFFEKKGVLVFDLYPLPLPTFVYDKVEFDCKVDSPYVEALIMYYKESLLDNNFIDDNTVIISRYAKFYKEKVDKKNQVVKNKSKQVVLDEKRFEWEIFMKAIDRKINDFKPIYGSYSADADKVKQVFQKILY